MTVQSPRTKLAGFSLCEVAIAMGIFVFVAVSLLGLMSTSLNLARSSVDMSTAVELANKVAGQFEREKFTQLPSLTTTYYFDDLGNPTQQGHAIYFVNTKLEPSISTNLKRLQITVSRGTNVMNERAFSYLLFNQDA